MKKVRFAWVLLLILASCNSTTAEKTTAPAVTATTETKPTNTIELLATNSITPTVQLLPSPTQDLAVPAPTFESVKWDSDDMGPIAYINDEGISLMNGDGYFVSQVYKSRFGNSLLGKEFAWSSDGKSMVFSADLYADIYLLDVSSGVAKNITNDRSNIEKDPAFSPDGENIVFVSNKENGEAGKPHMYLYTMNRDGSDIKLIYKCPNGQCGEPDWTSAGDRIVFTDYGDIYSIKPDGSDLKNLTNGKGYNYSPVWSPDGNKIAFIRQVDQSSDSGYLYTMNFDGTGLTPLTTDAGFARDVGSWSPDGRFIAFKYVTWDGPFAVYISDTSSGEIKQISSSEKFDPTWYPVATETYKPEEVIAQPDCTNGWSKLEAGEKARVAGDVDASPNRVRSGPSRSDEVIGEIKPQTVITVLEGPVCADGLVFWRFFSPLIEGNYGWTAEGDGTEYYLNPE